ncbi:MAG TPA: hypothetical protein VIJ17_01740, partial [Pseudolabrys sp.]
SGRAISSSSLFCLLPAVWAVKLTKFNFLFLAPAIAGTALSVFDLRAQIPGPLTLAFTRLHPKQMHSG